MSLLLFITSSPSLFILLIYSTIHYLSTMSAPSDTFQWTDINIGAEPILALHPAFSPLLNVDRLLKLFYIYLSLDFVVI
jgi:hypothetical protein